MEKGYKYSASGADTSQALGRSISSRKLLYITQTNGERHVWEFIQSSTPPYANSLSVMTQRKRKGQTVGDLAVQLWQHEESISASL